MRLDIRYTTRFRYGVPVTESQNELRACPASDARQHVVHYHVTTAPSSRVTSYVDYWGTRVDTFGIRAAHDTLEVVAEATVETEPQAPFTADPDPAELDRPTFRDRHLEFLQPSAHVDWGEAVVTEARRVHDRAGGRLHDVILAVHERAGGLEYESGETYVGVGVDEVFHRGVGVCQDFAHLAIAMYRSLGIPARYVSGYLFTADDASGADTDTDVVHVETHAWVEVALPGAGWYALDPTNGQVVGPRHVTIGRGRDYDDVAPFRGAYVGSPDHELDVSVTLRRLGASSGDGRDRDERRDQFAQQQQ